LPEPFAVRGDATAVTHRQVKRQCQPNTQSVTSLSVLAVDAREHFKDALKLGR
jgi:hypothetical protein